MADDLTTQSATPATVPASSKIATIDLGGAGRHAQLFTFGSKTATTSSVSALASSQQLLALNTARLGATLRNESNSGVSVKLGTTATASDYTIYMGPGSYYEVPGSYNGRIDAIWDTATGAMRITELT
jgi:hypothetical protein